MADVRYRHRHHGVQMHGVKETSLCILGEICLEFHGSLPEDSASHGLVKSTTMLSELEVSIGGCALFGAATALNMGASLQLIVHVGTEFPFSGLHPSNSQLLDDVLASAISTELVTEGTSGVFFSFWEAKAQSRTLYGKPGRGLQRSDLEGVAIGSDRIALLSQSDPGIYAEVRRSAEEKSVVVVCAPNRALAGNGATLADYLSWGDALVISRPEAEYYFGSHPERAIAAQETRRRAVVIITEASRDISVVAPDNSCALVRISRKADVALLGAGDSFATALACSWGGVSTEEAIRHAAAEVLNAQSQFRPR